MRTLFWLLVSLAASLPAGAQTSGFPSTVGSGLPATAPFPTETGVWGRDVPAPEELPAQAQRRIAPYEGRRMPLGDALGDIAGHVGLAIRTRGLSDRVVDISTPSGTALDALLVIARQEGLIVRHEGGVLHFAPGASSGPAPPPAPAETSPPDAPPPPSTSPVPPGVTVVRSAEGVPLVSVSVRDADVLDVLRDLASEAGLGLVTSASTSARVTATWDRVPLGDALHLLLLGTPLTHRTVDATVVVAERQLVGMLTSRLIPLRHIPAAGIEQRLPDGLRREASVLLVQEQNALLVTAPADIVAATEAFVAEIDREPAQILLEVLVVEFETTGLRKAGVSFLGGLLPDDPNAPALSEPGRPAYVFGGGDDQRGGLDVVGDATAGDRVLNFWSDVLGIRSIGRLPTDFYFRLQALERSGNAEVRSRPHIATLNGNTASISVGTSQYYILKSTYGYGQAGPFGTSGQAERFEYVRADVNLQITPYVTEGEDGAADEVTAVIRPSFATPVGAFDPRVPPTIRSWSVDTSVRLRDGETFMIGGLVQDQERIVENRVPLLGRIPFLGRLFRNTSRERTTGELVILITPHILTDGRSTLAERPHLAPRSAREHAPGAGGESDARW